MIPVGETERASRLRRIEYSELHAGRKDRVLCKTCMSNCIHYTPANVPVCGLTGFENIIPYQQEPCKALKPAFPLINKVRVYCTFNVHYPHVEGPNLQQKPYVE